MKKLVFFLAAVLLANVISPALLGGVTSSRAQYCGGTITAVPGNTEGAVTTTDERWFIFAHQNRRYTIPYERMNLLEFGQKAGRRLGLALAVSPLLLLSKKRRHFLTIHFQDEQGVQQAVVFELGKNIVRATLAGLEARTGLKIEYENEDARHVGRG